MGVAPRESESLAGAFADLAESGSRRSRGGRSATEATNRVRLRDGDRRRKTGTLRQSGLVTGVLGRLECPSGGRGIPGRRIETAGVGDSGIGWGPKEFELGRIGAGGCGDDGVGMGAIPIGDDGTGGVAGW